MEFLPKNYKYSLFEIISPNIINFSNFLCKILVNVKTENECFSLFNF